LIIVFYISGTNHTVTYTGNNTLSIGCYNKTIEEWKVEFRKIGKNNNYSESNILEYEKYILLAEQFAKIEI